MVHGTLLPRWIGVLLLVAGLAYAADSLSHLLLGPGGPLETALLVVLTLSSGVGEPALAVWLLARGGRGRGGDRPAATDARAAEDAVVAT